LGDGIVKRAAERVSEAWHWLYTSRRRLATAGVGLLALYVAAHAVFGANGFLVYVHKRAEAQKLDQQIEQLKQENDRLSENIKALKTDPAAIEREAREQLHYARPGEVIYTMPQPAVKPDNRTASNTPKK
jgi:cell division protein FtsB